jgi:hypothetical protein
MGRSPGQAGAPEALRAAGLAAVFGPDVVMEPDLVLPGPVAQRAAGSGLLNERALLQMIDALYRRVRASLSAGRFPFVYGADCSVLLAAVPALRDVAGQAGLVFVDGHEDATPMDLSTSGEAANQEIALLRARDLEKDEHTFPHELFGKLATAGFHAIGIPEEYGGQGGCCGFLRRADVGCAVMLMLGFGPGTCFAGRVLCPLWCCSGVLLLFAGWLWRARAERGRPAGAVFS